jgi:hypothetical protein
VGVTDHFKIEIYIQSLLSNKFAMGTWSRPLFTVTSPGPASSYTLDTSVLTEQIRNDWRRAAFLQDQYEPKIIWNLEEFMDTGCETHKIMGHISVNLIARWQQLFDILGTQNPTLESVQFHFYCIDNMYPYVFEWKRGVDNFTVNIATSDNILYTKKNPDYDTKYDEPELLFDDDAYKKNHTKVIYHSSIMKASSDIWYS